MTQNKKLAAIINAALSVLGIVLSLVPIIQNGTDIPSDQPPFAVLLSGVLLGVLGLAGSHGIWRGARWGVILTIVVRALDGLSVVPGLFLADSAWLLVWAIVSVVGAAVVIYLLVRRDAVTTAA